MKQYYLKNAVQTIINDINSINEEANDLHKAGNIVESGGIVEKLIREKLQLFLPERYLVKQGHVIDETGKVSNQFDIIIFDRFNTPKFYETQLGTVTYPIDSVLAVGEIKKTLKNQHTINFAKNMIHFRDVMKRNLVENPCFGNLSSNCNDADYLRFGTTQKYKNPLFTFIFAINGNLTKTSVGEPIDYFANDILILNDGYRMAGISNNGLFTPLMPDDGLKIEKIIDYKAESVELLSLFLNRLIQHLNKCYIEPFSIEKYLNNGEAIKFDLKNSVLRDVSNFRTIVEFEADLEKINANTGNK